jgi:hypothetical protein
VTEEEWWDARREELVRVFCTYDHDHLEWVLGYIEDEIAYHDSKAYEMPLSYRQLLMARDAVTAELGRRIEEHAA